MSVLRRLATIIFSLVCFVALTGCVFEVSTAQENLAARESRGRQIYVRGVSPSGKAIMAYISDQSLEVPGSSLPCASCHGLDGHGKPEGGINPSNITRETLTKPYPSAQANGRKHPPYTDRGLELAITRGVDPAGNKLLPVMPRYVMSPEDLADLTLYLARLGKDRDPGITENSLVIGTMLPTAGPLTEMGQAVKAVLTAYFAEVNNAGGIYSRRIDLKFAETAETPAATGKSLESFLASEQVFAMTGAFISGSEKEVLPVFAEKEVPLVGPVSLFPQTAPPLNRQVFYLLSGVEGQEQTLTEFAARKPVIKSAGIGIVYPENKIPGVVDAIRRQAKRSGLTEPQVISYVPGRFDAVETTRQLRQAKREAIFFLGSGDEGLSLMREAEKAGWFPFVFLASTGTEIFGAPAGFDGRIFLAFPTAPVDQTAEGTKEFLALATKYQLPKKHVAAQVLAYSGAKVLVEGLKRSGKDLSREKLIQTLEEFYDFRTGLTPAITYGPNRRVGALGSYVVTIDLKQKRFLAASEWIGID